MTCQAGSRHVRFRTFGVAGLVHLTQLSTESV